MCMLRSSSLKLTNKVWFILDSQIIFPISFHKRSPDMKSKCGKERPWMIILIKIMFAWKLDNTSWYFRAPAVQFDNNQHLQIYFSKDTPTRCSRLYKMPWLLENSWEPWLPEPDPKTKQRRKLFYPQQNSKIFLS